MYFQQVLDKAKLEKRKYYQNYRLQNRDKLNAYQRQWRKQNPNRVRTYQSRYWNSRADRADRLEKSGAEGKGESDMNHLDRQSRINELTKQLNALKNQSAMDPRHHSEYQVDIRELLEEFRRLTRERMEEQSHLLPGRAKRGRPSR